MRINELKRIAEENGYEFRDERILITISKKPTFGFENVVKISKNRSNRLWIHNGNCDDADLKMIRAAVEFAETPIEDREEEKKFYAKHRYLVQAGDYTTAFLNYATNNDRLYVYTKAQTYSVKTQFTLKEIEEIKKKFDTDLKDFELVEVVDEV